MGWTLQSLIDADMTVAAHCQRSACNHSQLLDLVQLRDRFGPDMPAMRDEPRAAATVLHPAEILALFQDDDFVRNNMP